MVDPRERLVDRQRESRGEGEVQERCIQWVRERRREKDGGEGRKGQKGREEGER